MTDFNIDVDNLQIQVRLFYELLGKSHNDITAGRFSTDPGEHTVEGQLMALYHMLDMLGEQLSTGQPVNVQGYGEPSDDS